MLNCNSITNMGIFLNKSFHQVYFSLFIIKDEKRVFNGTIQINYELVNKPISRPNCLDFKVLFFILSCNFFTIACFIF